MAEKVYIHQQPFNYIVWVGEIDDYYTNYEDAKKDYLEWISKGYDDIKLTDMNYNILMESDKPSLFDMNQLELKNKYRRKDFK